MSDDRDFIVNFMMMKLQLKVFSIIYMKKERKEDVYGVENYTYIFSRLPKDKS